MRTFLFRWFVMTVSMLGAVSLCGGFTYETRLALLEAAALFGLMSALMNLVACSPQFRPLFEKIGLFSYLMNAFFLFLVSKIIPLFHLDAFSSALWGSALISLFSLIITFFGLVNRRVSAKSEQIKIKTAKAKVISKE